MNLFFDLDGTLIDSRPRLYRLFQDLVPQSRLRHDEYWAYKRNKISNETLLAREFGFDLPATERFVHDWMDLIETEEYLRLDQNFPGMCEALERLTRSGRLHVCTARQKRDAAVNQLERLGLSSYFDTILVTEQVRDKADLIGQVGDLSSDDWIIGDTGKDIQVGQRLGLKTCAVCSGFLSKECLRSYGPDLLLAGAADFRP